MTELRGRLIRGVGATGYSQFVTVVVQFISVPLYLHNWGNQLYGEWLILSSAASFLGMSDIGFYTVAANQMTMMIAQRDRPGALKVFQSVWLLISGISLVAFLACSSAVWALPIESWFKISHFSHWDAALVFLLLALYVLFGLQMGLVEAGFRCEGKYALGTFSVATSRMLESFSAFGAVALGASPVMVASVFCAARLLFLATLRILLSRVNSWAVFGVEHADRNTIRSLASPAFAFMGFPIGNAISLQGTAMVIGSVLGPSSVVAFSTMRTLSRVGLQAMSLINSTVWPEFSIAFGAKDIQLMKSLHHHSCRVSVWFLLAVGITLLLAGPFAFNLWTRGKVEFDHTLFDLLLIVILANSLWYTSSVALAATNRHQGMAGMYVLGTSISVLASLVLTREWGLNGAALSLLAVDVFMATYVVRKSLALVQDRLPDFVLFVLKPPGLWRTKG